MDLRSYAEDGVRETGYRFPIITTAYPRWCYVTAVVAGGSWDGQDPTEDELRIIASFHEEYVERTYYNSFKAEMRRKHPFDIDGGANSRLLIKYPSGGWGYRHSSWQDGPTFAPSVSEPALTLLECLDREQRYGATKPNPTWEAWKAAHPDVFQTDKETAPTT